MKYTLITPVGQIYTFFLLAAATCYQQAYGGQLITAGILVDKVAV